MATAAQLQLEVLTLDGKVYDEPVYEVVVPTIGGDLGILPHHIPLTSVTKLGVVSIRKQAGDSNESLDHLVISEGLLEVDNERVRLLVDEAAHVDSLDQKEIDEQIAAAKAKLQTAQDHREIASAEAAIRRGAMWLRAAELGRSRNAR